MAFTKQVDLLEPIDMAEHLDKIELYLGQVCQIAGISKMQLDYWTNKAQIPTKGKKQRIYDMDALETVMLIKQAKDKGLNLGAATLVGGSARVVADEDEAVPFGNDARLLLAFPGEVLAHAARAAVVLDRLQRRFVVQTDQLRMRMVQARARVVALVHPGEQVLEAVLVRSRGARSPGLGDQLEL